MENLQNNEGINRMRDYKYDNIRFLLIFLVVFGHGLELFMTENTEIVYKMIYSFHIPALLYLSGKFARFDKKKILKHLIFPYIIFQTLYTCFDALVISNKELVFQYSTPYWLMWYMMAMIMYYLLLPMLPEKKSKNSYIVIALSVIISLAIGYELTISYYMSLSRMIVFAPFFLLGYYDDYILEKIGTINRAGIIRKGMMALSIIIIVFGEIYLTKSDIPKQALYGSYPYQIGYNALQRSVFLLIALAWIIILKNFTTNKKIPVISALGKNTIAIFLCHGFIIKLMGKTGFFHYSTKENFIIMFGIAILITIAFGNKYIAKVFAKIF